jgi:hypothetical protein
VLVNPLSVVRLESSFHCAILFFIVNHSFLPPQMPQHFWKATAKLVIFSKSAKEKTKKHKVFLSF